MASPIRCLSTLLVASSILFLSLLPPTLSRRLPTSTQLVQDVCKKTVNEPQCLKVLNSDPRARSASNYKDLAHAALDLAIANAKHSESFIRNLADRDPRKAIKDCVSSYEAVVGSFRSAKGEIEEDAMTANYDSKIAGDDAIECETSLSNEGIKVAEISSRNKVVQIYSNIADVVTDRLQ